MRMEKNMVTVRGGYIAAVTPQDWEHEIDWGGKGVSASWGDMWLPRGFILFCTIHTRYRHTFMIQHIMYMYLHVAHSAVITTQEIERKNVKKIIITGPATLGVCRCSARVHTLYAMYSMSGGVLCAKHPMHAFGACPGSPRRSLEMTYKSQDLTHAGWAELASTHIPSSDL